MRAKRSKLLLAVASTVVALLAAEVALRLKVHLEDRGLLGRELDPGVAIPADRQVDLVHIIRLSAHPRIIYELRPGIEAQFHGAAMRIDERGFRVVTRPVSNPEAFRIVGIGDSVMFGWGVAGHKAYLSRLAAVLGERYPTRAFDVVNTAVPGYNTAMEVATLEEKGLALAPDLVVVGFVGNDLALPNFILKARPVFTLGRSFLVDAFRKATGVGWTKSAWNELHLAGMEAIPQEGIDGVQYLMDPSRVPEEYRDLVGWEAYSSALERLHVRSLEHGFTVVWVALSPGSGPIKQRAAEIAADRGFIIVDLGPVYRRYMKQHGLSDYASSPLALSPGDTHPSALGHELAAEEIAAVLIERGVIEPR